LRNIQPQIALQQQSISRFFVQDLTFERKNECRLKQIDPWDPQLFSYLRPHWNPYKACRINRQMHTEFKCNTIRMLDNTTSECEFRCLYADSELDFKTSNWTKMKRNEAYHASCDFIETHCREGGNTTFRYIHSQARYLHLATVIFVSASDFN
uniref:Apple domain-containing protein n=1 Tax=Elaeophora elaphi TaxID=1147741 RepID=A0A0R3RNV3_9BILA